MSIPETIQTYDRSTESAPIHKVTRTLMHPTKIHLAVAKAYNSTTYHPFWSAPL